MANFIKERQDFLKNVTPEFLQTLSPEELTDVERMMDEEESSGRQTSFGMLGALANEKTRNRAIKNFDISGPLSDLGEVARSFLPGQDKSGLISGMGSLVKGGLEELRPGG
jgi:hypothetical protein